MIEWISLSNFFHSLWYEDSPYKYRFDREQVLVNMMASGAVPVRAKLAGETAYRRIETSLTYEMKLYTYADRIEEGVDASFRRVRYEEVQLDKVAADA
jgi:hypothetical protein